MKRVETLITKVREIAQAEPDRKYLLPDFGDTCSYFPTELNPCGCLIGYAARECGWPLDADRYDLVCASEAVAVVLGISKLTNRGALAWLQRVQDDQDGGNTWAEAVAWADEMVATRQLEVIE